METQHELTQPISLLPNDEELRRALHTYGEADQRWSERKASGLTDDQLWAAISEELGIFGASGGPNMREVIHRGGSNPAVWIDHDEEGLGLMERSGRPELKGQALLYATRRILAIHQPDVAGKTIPLF